MGGRALKLAYTRRYELEEYLKLQDEMVEILSNDFEQVSVPLYYREKNSFGDMDIIVTWPTPESDTERGQKLRAYIEETFNPTEIFHNDRSWSFNVDEIQVDIIMCEPENYDAMRHYLSYNDLGNFIGRLAHGLGLKYGQDGLVYDHYFKGSKIGRIMVSQDYPRIFEFLGLDYTRWERGFDTLEDIFQYIVESKYFNYDKFQLKALNKINRDRNIKRASYMAFLEYIEGHQDKKFVFLEEKEEYVQKAAKFFPEFQYKLEVRRLEYEKTRDLYVQVKFNGGELVRRFGLEGREIGLAIEEFKNLISTRRAGLDFREVEETFKDYVLEKSIEEIYSDFNFFLQHFLKREINKSGLDVNNFNDFTESEYRVNLLRLGVMKHSDLIGKEVYYAKSSYGIHEVLKWDPDKGEYFIQIKGDKSKFWTNPFRLHRVKFGLF